MANMANNPLDEDNEVVMGRVSDQNKTISDLLQNKAFTDMLQAESNKLVRGKRVVDINQVNTAQLIDFVGEFIGITHALTAHFAFSMLDSWCYDFWIIDIGASSLMCINLSMLNK